MTNALIQNLPMPCNEMNETELCEHIIKPLLERLGYRWGQEAQIRSQKPLTYDKAFLGHKKKTDKPLRGKVDYVCEVVSHGRFIVEVKKPGEVLDQDVSNQAYTYTAHPEIAAWFYLITNGHLWRVYRLGDPVNPVLEWTFSEWETRGTEIANIIGPDALRRLSAKTAITAGKPLAVGLGPTAEIVGGWVRYEKTTSDNPSLGRLLKGMDGMNSPIRGGKITRNGDMIHAEVDQAGTYEGVEAFNRMLGLNNLIYNTATEYISTDSENPTIFQNLLDFDVNEGLDVPQMGPYPAAKVQMDHNIKAITQATGYLENGHFKGVFAIEYYYTFYKLPRLPHHLRHVMQFTEKMMMKSVGCFDICLR